MYLAIMVYCYVVVNKCNLFRVNDITYIYYTVDYSMGFCSRLLPGAVYSLIGVYTEKAVSIYLTVLYMIFLFLCTVMIKRFIDAFKLEKRTAVIVSVLFVVGPFTAGMLIRQFGLLDFHWLLLFAASFWLLNNKYSKYTSLALPVVVAAMVAVNYGAMICYVPLLLLLVLFRLVSEENTTDKRMYAVAFVLTLIVAVALTGYFVVNDKNNLVYTREQFDKIVTGERKGIFPTYYDFYLYDYVAPYNKYYELLKNTESGNGVFYALFAQIKTTMALSAESRHIVINALALPIQGLLTYVLISYLREKNNRTKRMISVLVVLLSFAVEFIGALFSTDNIRWAGHAVIILFVYTLFVLFYDYHSGIKKIENIFNRIGCVPLYTIIFLYGCIIADPYSLPGL